MAQVKPQQDLLACVLGVSESRNDGRLVGGRARLAATATATFP